MYRDTLHESKCAISCVKIEIPGMILAHRDTPWKVRDSIKIV